MDTTAFSDRSGAPVKLKRDIQRISSTLLMVAPDDSSNLDSSDAMPLSPASIKRKSPVPNKKQKTGDKEASSQKINGPRIKHVCRSQHVIKGLPRATFSLKQRSPSTSPKRAAHSANGHLSSPIGVISSTPLTPSPNSHGNITVASKKASLKKNKLGKPANPQKKAKKLADQATLSNVHPLTSYSPIVKSPKNVEQNGTSKGFVLTKKLARCKKCAGCRAQDCGECIYCLDKKKFGGPNIIKQACKFRKCVLFSSPTRASPNPVISPKPTVPKKVPTVKKNKPTITVSKSPLKSHTPAKPSAKIQERLAKMNSLDSKKSRSDASESDTSLAGNRVSLGYMITAGNSGHGKPSLSGSNLRNGTEQSHCDKQA